MRTALIVIDPQVDFLLTKEDDIIREKIKEMADRADVTIATKSEHCHQHSSFSQFGPHCIKGTKGAKLAIDKEYFDYVITKRDFADREEAFSAFEAGTLRPLESLEQILHTEKIATVVVCGWGHAWDVTQTAFDANALGYDTFVLSNECPFLTNPDQERLENAGVKVNDN